MNGEIYFLFGVFTAAFITKIGCVWKKYKRKLRIEELTSYLEAVNCGKEQILFRKEDELSILEDEIGKTVRKLRIAKEQEQNARKRQADNLADIAHQLKTPITSMFLMTDLLIDESTASQRECLERLNGQLHRLENLTSALLLMSRLDAGVIVFRSSLVKFEELMARAAEPVEQLLKERGQTLFVRNGENIVLCDILWTAEAILNLIKNCSEQIEKGGHIMAECTVTPLYTQITIEDDGKGFQKEEIHKLFYRFFRGKNAAPNSIGIGLALTCSIIEGQEGVIHAENRREGGARFVLRFYSQKREQEKI